MILCLYVIFLKSKIQLSLFKFIRKHSKYLKPDKELIQFFNTHTFESLDLGMKEFTSKFEVGRLFTK